MCSNCSSPKFINHISSVPPALMKAAEDLPLLSKFKDIHAMAYVSRFENCRNGDRNCHLAGLGRIQLLSASSLLWDKSREFEGMVQRFLKQFSQPEGQQPVRTQPWEAMRV